MEQMNRRRVLASTGTALAAALAGCSTGGETETDGGADATSAEDTTEGEDETTTEGEDETTTDGDATTTDGGDETTAGSVAETVVVGPNGDFEFSPSSLTVSTGDTVEWTWDSGGHNVVVASQPEGADWAGTEGDSSTTYDSGHSHRHTFETAGTYEYYCQPHRSVGMAGTVTVE